MLKMIIEMFDEILQILEKMVVKRTGLKRDAFYTAFVCMFVLSAFCYEIYSCTILIFASGCEFNTTLDEQLRFMSKSILVMATFSSLFRYLGIVKGLRGVELILVITCSANQYANTLTDFSTFCYVKYLTSTLMATAWRTCNDWMYQSLPKEKKYAALVTSNFVILVTTAVFSGDTWFVLKVDLYYCTPNYPVPFTSWRALHLLCSHPAIYCAGYIEVIRRLKNRTPNDLQQKPLLFREQVIEMQEINSNKTQKKLKIAIRDICKDHDFMLKYVLTALSGVWVRDIVLAVIVPLSFISYLTIPYEGDEGEKLNKTVCKLVEESIAHINFTFKDVVSRKYAIPGMCSKKRTQVDPTEYILDLDLNVITGICCFIAVTNMMVITMFSSIFIKEKTKITFIGFSVEKKYLLVAIQVIFVAAVRFLNKPSAFYTFALIFLSYVLCLLTLGLISSYKLYFLYDGYIIPWSMYTIYYVNAEMKRVDAMIGNLKNCAEDVIRYSDIVFAGIIWILLLPSITEKKSPLTPPPIETTIIYEVTIKNVEVRSIQEEV